MLAMLETQIVPHFAEMLLARWHGFHMSLSTQSVFGSSTYSWGKPPKLLLQKLGYVLAFAIAGLGSPACSSCAIRSVRSYLAGPYHCGLFSISCFATAVI